MTQVNEPWPKSMPDLVNKMELLEDLLFLSGRVTSDSPLVMFHGRFWDRIQANNRNRASGVPEMTVQHIVTALMMYQALWKTKSRGMDTLDNAILACLPAPDDELDVRMCMLPAVAHGIQPARQLAKSETPSTPALTDAGGEGVAASPSQKKRRNGRNAKAAELRTAVDQAYPEAKAKLKRQ